MRISKAKARSQVFINGVFLVTLNLATMGIFGYCTIDSEANLNSRIAAIGISFLLPFFIVSLSKEMKGLERLLKLGTGLILYVPLGIIYLGFPYAFISGLVPCLFIATAVLYYGDTLIKS